MAVKSPERQYPLTAVVELTYDQLPTGVATEVIDLPVGAVVLGGGAFVDTADDGGTSVVLDVGDNDAGDLYVTDLDAKTANESEAFDVTEIGKKYPSGGAITATRTEGGTASTAGKVRIFATYLIFGRANEVQAN
jgi:hypothetical protein